MTRIATTFLVLLLAAGLASAAPVTFLVQVETPNFGQIGSIDFSFVQVDSLTSLPATLTVSNFVQAGYTLDYSDVERSGAGVTGQLDPAPVTIPNDESANNYFTQHVGAAGWGSAFSFLVTIDGAAVGTPAPNGSVFRLTLFDEFYSPLAGTLADGEIANIAINPDGTLSAAGSRFDGGSASIAQTPEPATMALGGIALAGLVWLRRKRA